MIDMFIQLVDRIITLLKTRSEARVNVFREIVEPLYNDMTLVVQDYLSLFREAESFIASDRPDSEHRLRQVIDSMRERRERHLHLRIRTREIANLIRNSVDDPLVADFADSIVQFFVGVKGSTGELRSSSAALLGYFELLEYSDLNKAELYDFVKLTQAQIEQSWAAVTKAYAAVRIEYLVGLKLRSTKAEAR